MRLYRMTNSQGELVMIAPLHTFQHFRLLTEAECRVLEIMTSGQKWAALVHVRDEVGAPAYEFQFEALPLEIPQAQSGLAEIAAPLEPPQTTERELVHVPEENESGCPHCG